MKLDGETLLVLGIVAVVLLAQHVPWLIPIALGAAGIIWLRSRKK